jgi:hypothetical protein
MRYYTFNPIWKDNSKKSKSDFYFIGDNSICGTKFKSIQDGLIAAKLDGTGLREENWEILECGWILKTRIMLESLYNKGYLSDKIDKDDISLIYNFK